MEEGIFYFREIRRNGYMGGGGIVKSDRGWCGSTLGPRIYEGAGTAKP